MMTFLVRFGREDRRAAKGAGLVIVRAGDAVPILAGEKTLDTDPDVPVSLPVIHEIRAAVADDGVETAAPAVAIVADEVESVADRYGDGGLVGTQIRGV